MKGRTVVLAVALCLFLPSPAAAEGLVKAAGGMGLGFWFMEIDGVERTHQRVGIGISGRVFLKVGNFFRMQGGLIQGRFTEDDETSVKRNLVEFAVEAVHHFDRRMYMTLGMRAGADHLSMIETVGFNADGSRHVVDMDRWSMLWQPILTIGMLLGGKYHIELENGVAFDYTDSEVNISYTIVMGIYFGMGG